MLESHFTRRTSLIKHDAVLFAVCTYFFCMLPALAGPLPVAADTIEKITADSHNESDGSIYDTEEYTVEKSGGAVRKITVRYSDATGTQIAELVSDFSSHRYLPDSEFNDLRNGYSYKVQVHGALEPTPTGEVEIQSRLKKDAEWKKQTIPIEADMMTLPGTSLYLEDHLKDYAASGGSKVIKFIVPSRAAAYSVKISADGIDKEHKQTFHIRPDNFFIRLVAPRIDVVADTKSGQITEVRGVSNIRTRSGGTATVRTVYKYPPENAPKNEPKNAR